MMNSKKIKERNKDLLNRINQARQDRARRSSKINEFYTFACDNRFRVGESRSSSSKINDEDEVFDSTLRIEVLDFSANQRDFFMPDYKPWVKREILTDFDSTTDETQANEFIREREEKLYNLIAGTDFYEQCQEVMIDLAGGAAAMAIPMPDIHYPVTCYPVLMNSLLMERGANNDVDGRWAEAEMQKRHIKRIFTGADFSDIPSFETAKESRLFSVTHGVHKHWGNKGIEWVESVVVENKVVKFEKMGVGVPAIMSVCRWRDNQNDCWGPGPVDAIMPEVRTLDEIAYQHLKGLGLELQPPFSYEADGIQNFPNGIQPGGNYPRRRGTKPPEQMLRHTAHDGYFDREELQAAVRKGLYTDHPEQKGKTPPTTVQWLDEKAIKERREQARLRIYREFVVPTLQRFDYIFVQRGELPPLELGDLKLHTRMVSPLSKASDANEVSVGMQLAKAGIATFGETALASMDAFETMKNWKEKMGDATVVLKQPDQQADLIQEILGQGRNLINE